MSNDFLTGQNALLALTLPAFLRESRECIEIQPPAEHDSKLLFQVFCNGIPIGYARLRKMVRDESYDDQVVQLFSAHRRPTYVLKLIEVGQNYRNRGIGSALLQEIIHYCRHHNIRRLIGDIHGDQQGLQRWYMHNGFTVDANNRLELLLD